VFANPAPGSLGLGSEGWLTGGEFVFVALGVRFSLAEGGQLIPCRSEHGSRRHRRGQQAAGFGYLVQGALGCITGIGALLSPLPEACEDVLGRFSFGLGFRFPCSCGIDLVR
jgi:hypothetical protein